MRATASGARAYIFEARLFGKTIRTTIGDTRSWELGKAQAEANRQRGLVDRNIDPREDRVEKEAAHAARRTEAKRRNVTFGEAWDEYVAARRPSWGDLHYRDHLRMADLGGATKKRGEGVTQPGPLAELRPAKLSDLSGDRIAAWLTPQAAERPTMAALAFRLLRAFIRWCGETTDYRGLFPADAYTARRVKEAVPRVRAKEGDVLQREQLAAWFREVQALPNLVHSVYLQGLLITGARREELAALRWSADLDLEWRSLTLNDKVEGTGGRTIPLPPHLAELLHKLNAHNGKAPSKRVLKRLKDRGTPWAPSPWIFPSMTSADGKLAEPRIAHIRALEAAKLPHVSLHGLRRSFGTLSEWCEAPVGVVAQIQGHKPSAIAEKHYRRRPLDLLRMWHDRIEAWMLEQGGVTSTKTKGTSCACPMPACSQNWRPALPFSRRHRALTRDDPEAIW